MTIIFQNGNEFWIESFTVARATITQEEVDTDFTLERAGFFLGASLTLDHDLGFASADDVAGSIEDLDNSQLLYAQRMSQIRVHLSNASSSGRIFGANLIVYMRGSAR